MAYEPAAVRDERLAATAALEKRFGWLKRRVVLHAGNLAALPEHEQRLWRARERVVADLNHAGTLRDAARRLRVYQKLQRELSR